MNKRNKEIKRLLLEIWGDIEDYDNECYNFEAVTLMLRDLYILLKPYLKSDELPKWCIPLMRGISICSGSIYAHSADSRALILVVNAFIYHIVNVGKAENTDIIVFKPTEKDDTGSLLASKNEYYYDIMQMDLSDIISMLQDVLDKNDDEVECFKTNYFGVPGLTKELEDYYKYINGEQHNNIDEIQKLLNELHFLADNDYENGIDVKRTCTMLKDLYNLIKPYITGETFPMWCLPLMRCLSIYAYSPFAQATDEMACLLACNAFIYHIQHFGDSQNPDIIIFNSDLRDENGNQITSKTTYYYDLHKMDLSDLMQMIEEVSANYHGNISYNATKCWGISDLMQESMDYDAYRREMLFDFE